MRYTKTIILCLLVLLGLIFFSGHQSYADGPLEPLYVNGSPITYFETSDPVMTPSTYTERNSEFRGVWVATVYNLNIPLATSEAQYKLAYSNLLDSIENRNMNAIIFQVRPMNDAFYDSAYAPWSKYLTGTEGEDPGWDVMQYFVDEAHARGIEFHAWMNPYRVTSTGGDKTTLLNALHPENFARLNPSLVIPDDDGKLILNPGEPNVKNYIRNVVTEIMDLYDVDGIHFDDYFYPYAGLSSDSATYDAYKLPGQTLGDWRRENVNDVIHGVKDDVDLFNSTNGAHVRFGVSPFGIWKTGGLDGSNTASYASESYYDQFADSKKWVEEGWLHYICPQVYWNFGGSAAPYADVVDWWAETVRGTGVDLIIGMGIYKTEYDVTEFYHQLKYNQKHPEIVGSALYSAAYLNTSHMTYVETNAWTIKPLNIWLESSVASPTYSMDGVQSNDQYIGDVTVTLSATDTIYYKIDQGDWVLYDAPIVFTHNGLEVLYYKAVDALDNESLINSLNVEINRINNDIPVISVSGSMIGTSYVIDSVVSITATEEIWVAINHGSIGDWVLYTGPITLDETGNYYIQTKTINSEGTESNEQTLLISVVLEAYPSPVLSISGVGSDPYYQDPVITITGSSPSISYKINDGEWVVYSTSFSISEEGEYTIYYRNDDALSTVLSKTITVDQTAPTEPNIAITGAFDGWYYTEEVGITLTKIDEDDQIFFRLHNGKTWSNWQLYQDPILLMLNATYTLEYYAVDLAENITDTYEQRIRLNMPASETNLYVVRDGEIVNYYNTSTHIELPTSYTEKEFEIRAVWVATVSNIDIGLHTSEADYKSKIIVMLDRLEANNFNTMFFQVRPMNDAFYESSLAPYSRFLMGTEGVGPDWDVLSFIIDEAHQRGIEFHAWLNPYRVSSDTISKEAQLAMLSDQNFAKLNPGLVLQDNSGKLILNPGENQVRSYIKSVISELMANYDIDGIHFDDYFYSYNGMSDSQDLETYNRTKEANQTLDDWRRSNVDVLIEDIFHMVETYNSNNDDHVKFGISPFGIWQSGGLEGSNTSPYTMQSYSDQYADTKKWVEEGWLHYIMPQLYWQFDHSSAPFADLVDWWAELCEASDVSLIIGQGFYRYADNSWTDANELLEQIRYMSQYDIIIGSSFFSYKTLISPNANVVQAIERLNNYYWTEYPAFPWESDVVKSDPITCDIDQTLVDGECVDNPPVCTIDQTLIDGECVDNHPVECPSGYELIDDSCVLIPVEEPEGLEPVIRAIILGGATITLVGLAFVVKKVIFKI